MTSRRLRALLVPLAALLAGPALASPPPAPDVSDGPIVFNPYYPTNVVPYYTVPVYPASPWYPGPCGTLVFPPYRPMGSNPYGPTPASPTASNPYGPTVAAPYSVYSSVQTRAGVPPYAPACGCCSCGCPGC